MRCGRDHVFVRASACRLRHFRRDKAGGELRLDVLEPKMPYRVTRDLALTHDDVRARG